MTSDLSAVCQVVVVAEAYGFSPDWVEILFHKVLVNGDFVYLDDFKRQRALSPALGPALSPALLEDILRK